VSEAASGFFIIGRQQGRSAEENHKKERKNEDVS
jgi:hypothetical protein